MHGNDVQQNVLHIILNLTLSILNVVWQINSFLSFVLRLFDWHNLSIHTLHSIPVFPFPCFTRVKISNSDYSNIDSWVVCVWHWRPVDYSFYWELHSNCGEHFTLSYNYTPVFMELLNKLEPINFFWERPIILQLCSQIYLACDNHCYFSSTTSYWKKVTN